ncbi:MAG TPA: hypothetical protein VIL09_13915 [Microvirga sp.]|jgi:hypothetical protein
MDQTSGADRMAWRLQGAVRAVVAPAGDRAALPRIKAKDEDGTDPALAFR